MFAHRTYQVYGSNAQQKKAVINSKKPNGNKLNDKLFIHNTCSGQLFIFALLFMHRTLKKSRFCAIVFFPITENNWNPNTDYLVVVEVKRKQLEKLFSSFFWYKYSYALRASNILEKANAILISSTIFLPAAVREARGIRDVCTILIHPKITAEFRKLWTAKTIW